MFMGCVVAATSMKNMKKSSSDHIKWKISLAYKQWEKDHLSEEAGCHRVVKLDCGTCAKKDG